MITWCQDSGFGVQGSVARLRDYGAASYAPLRRPGRPAPFPRNQFQVSSFTLSSIPCLIPPPACGLLIHLPLVIQPACCMESFGITVGPVDHTAFCIRLVLTQKRDRVANGEICNPRGDVDVVRDQQRLSRRQFDDKPLMPTSRLIIRQYSNDRP